MKPTMISKGGQVSITADQIGAAVGFLAGPGPGSDELRSLLRKDDETADERRYGLARASLTRRRTSRS